MTVIQKLVHNIRNYLYSPTPIRNSTLTGLLKVGVPQPWEKSKKNLNYVREAGVRQFISTYNRVKDLKGDELLWGDEIEYGIFILDPENKKIRLSLRAKEVRAKIDTSFAFPIEPSIYGYSSCAMSKKINNVAAHGQPQ